MAETHIETTFGALHIGHRFAKPGDLESRYVKTGDETARTEAGDLGGALAFSATEAVVCIVVESSGTMNR